MTGVSLIKQSLVMPMHHCASKRSSAKSRRMADRGKHTTQSWCALGMHEACGERSGTYGRAIEVMKPSFETPGHSPCTGALPVHLGAARHSQHRVEEQRSVNMFGERQGGKEAAQLAGGGLESTSSSYHGVDSCDDR